MMFNETRFYCHGATSLGVSPAAFEYEPLLKQLSPAPIRASAARVLIETFLKSGYSTHSGKGGSVWVIVEYCQAKGLQYGLTGTPCEGYCIELL